MHTRPSIQLIKDIFNDQRIQLPEKPGVYAFWWLDKRETLLQANRHIKLSGPGGRLIDVEFMKWWSPELEYPCLYVGKSTNIKKRFPLHIKRGSTNRLHQIPNTNEKQKPVTTTCQLRYGIEHIFPKDEKPLDIIFNSVGFSFTSNFPEENALAERFFTENRLIGTWRPWFNVDSER